MLGKIEVGAVETATGAEFSGEQSDHSELGPLPESKRLEELLPGVLKRERNSVHGGDRQDAPRARNDSGARYCELRYGANQFVRKMQKLRSQNAEVKDRS